MPRQDVVVDPLEELASTLSLPLLLGPDAAGHETPWRGLPGPALAVARPVGEAEVRSTVLWARRHGIRVLPQGAVTGLVGASTPPPSGPEPLVLSTDAMATRLEIVEADAVAVVDAGVRLSALNEAAGRVGLELPVDLAADPSIGAMVATNTGGSRVLTHGDMSHHVLGVEAVIADEGASRIGSTKALRKDNTGPDPTRLLVGSAGAFGIITAVALSLSPLPAERSTVLAGPMADTAAVELLAVLRRTLGRTLSAFEVMCPAAVEAGLSRARPSGRVEAGHDPDVLVLAEASGAHGCGEALVEAVTTVGLPGTRDGVPGALMPAREAWALRHAITEGLRARGEVLGFDLSVRPSDLPALRAAVRELVARTDPDLVVADFGHWGDGGIHANVVVPTGHALPGGSAEELRSSIYAVVTDTFGGSWSAEHGVGPLNAAEWTASTAAAERALLASLKDTVDPMGILGHPGLPFG